MPTAPSLERDSAPRSFGIPVPTIVVAQQSDTDRRRAIELLAGSAKQGCTEAFLLAGLRSNCWPRWSELASQLRRSSAPRAGGQTRVHITNAGRRALREKRAVGQWKSHAITARRSSGNPRS